MLLCTRVGRRVGVPSSGQGFAARGTRPISAHESSGNITEAVGEITHLAREDHATDQDPLDSCYCLSKEKTSETLVESTDSNKPVRQGTCFRTLQLGFNSVASETLLEIFLQGHPR